MPALNSCSESEEKRVEKREEREREKRTREGRKGGREGKKEREEREGGRVQKVKMFLLLWDLLRRDLIELDVERRRNAEKTAEPYDPTPVVGSW